MLAKGTFSLDKLFNFSLLKSIRGLAVGWRLKGPYYSFWFILTTFIAELILYYICKFTDDKKHKNTIYAIIAVILSIIGAILIKFVKGFIWSSDIVPIALAFMIFGYLYKINKEKIKSFINNFDMLLVVFAINAIITYINYKYYGVVDLFYCKIGNYFLFMIAAITGIILTMMVSNKISSSNVLEYIGKNTFIFYFFHYQIVFKICNLILDLLKSIIPINDNIRFYSTIILSTIICSIIAYVINKFFPFLMGKWYKKKENKEIKEAKNNA
ncbi:MAG: acyltransferase family protein [Clostridia bacterium]|nr:acyltransferase family protein [Clostridia bacterium]